MLGDRASAAAGFALLNPRAFPGALGGRRVERTGEAHLVVDRARDLHAQVFLLPGPAGRDRRLVADQRIQLLPFVEDLVAHHPILVGGVDRQQVDPAGVDHRGSVRGRQPAFGVARIRHQPPDVVADLHRGEVVDRARPCVVGVEQRRRGRAGRRRPRATSLQRAGWPPCAPATASALVASPRCPGSSRRRARP